MEALTSRSNKVLQLLQVHSRSFSVNSLLMLPQHEQSFDDGSNRPILRMFLPYHSALYSNISTNIDHPQSEIDSASLWFESIPFMFKSSIQIVWLSLISLLEVLWRKSLRWLATFSCNFANLFFVRFGFWCLSTCQFDSGSGDPLFFQIVTQGFLSNVREEEVLTFRHRPGLYFAYLAFCLAATS